MIAVKHCFLLVALLLLTPPVHADVTLRPNEKPKESTKDFTKDQKKNGFVSPEAVDRSAQFVAGQSVQIELQVSTAYLGYVKFVIRDQPKHGTLSEIRSAAGGDSNRAVVTYTHNGDPDQLSDRFTFAARIAEGSASAPGVVTLTGKKAVARLEVLDPPKFKRLAPGEQDSGTFVVFNSGNAAFSGDLILPAPFTGPRHFDVAVNEKLTVMVMVKPVAPGAYHIDQELQPGVPSSKLQGVLECAQPFIVTPGSLTLTYDPVSGMRSGTVKVSNGSNEPLNLKVDSGARIQVAKEMALDSHGTSELTITMAKEDVAAYRGEVWVVQEPSRQKVVIIADAKPAQIRLLTPKDGKLDFGTVTKGTKVEAKVSVINDGGLAAVLQASQVPPFLISTDLSKIKAEPGKPTEIVISFAADLPGTYNQSLYIAGNAGRLELNVRGTMIDPSRPSTGVTPGGAPATGRARDAEPAPPRPSALRPSVSAPPIPSARVPVSQPPAPVPAPAATSASKGTYLPPAAPAIAPGVDSAPPANATPLSKMSPKEAAAYSRLMTFGVSPTTMPPFQSRSLDPVPKIGVSDLGKDNLVLQWEEPKIAPLKYLLETSFMVRNTTTGLWLKVWKPYDSWETLKSPQSGLAAARVTGLTPETQYELRVLGIDHDGKFSAPSDIVQIATLSPFRLPGWTWPALGGVILLAVAYTTYQLKQGDWQS
ncbi:MAG: fibronectin type protein [Verrucomicrobiaceae bacterium]|nr:fibronectin type protein [Verrucomicrobiaceae bacterium]